MFSKKIEYIVTIEGMMCQNCANHVIEAIKSIKGVKKVSVDLNKKTATITSTQELAEEDVKKVITEVGYGFIEIKSV